MIKKEAFVNIVDGLQTYWDKLSELEKVFGIYITEGFLTDIVDDITEALASDTEESLCTEKFGSWLSYYAFELDFGRSDMAIDCVEFKNEKYSLQTADQLYDLIMLFQDKEVKTEKHYCACEQLRWERDIAMEQLQEHGIPFGGIADDVVKVVRCKNCNLFKTFEDMKNDPDGLYDNYPMDVGMAVGDGLCSNVGRWTVFDGYCFEGEENETVL